eukprot:scaffold9694_cov28-Attheya_sp.AAC.3
MCARRTVYDRKGQKPDEKKKSKPNKEKKKKKSGIASLTVPQLNKEQLKILGLSLASVSSTASASAPPPSSSPATSTTTTPIGSTAPHIPEREVSTTADHQSPAVPGVPPPTGAATATGLILNPPHHQDQIQQHTTTTGPPLDPELGLSNGQDDQPEPDGDASIALSNESIDSNDSADSEDLADSADSNDDINEIMNYLDLCERGLVADTSPTQPPVPSHVENNRGTLPGGFFLDLDDATDGIAGLADPDELEDFGCDGDNY